MTITVSAAAIVMAVGCGTRGDKPNPGSDRAPHVETVTPQLVAVLPVRVDVTALVEAMERADLCVRVPGLVETLQPDPEKPETDIGRRVKADEPLLKVAVPELVAELRYKEALAEQAKRQLEQAREVQNVAAKELAEAIEVEKRYQSELNQRKAKHDRTARLVQSGSLQPEAAEETLSMLEAAESAWRVSRAAIETRQAKLSQSAADYKVAESRVGVAQREAERLRVLVGYATVRAPFDGIVTRRMVDRGAMVKDTATPVLTVVRTDKVRVLIDIPERYVPLVNATDRNPNRDGRGDMVTLRIAALNEHLAGGEFTGPIEKVGVAVDPVTRTMRAEVHLDNKTGYLRPGMFGTASVMLEALPNALTIPSSAIVRRDGKILVSCVEITEPGGSRGPIRLKEVKLGVDDGKRVQVREGLRGDEVIIARGNGVIREGDVVRAMPVTDE
jgi:RND family efflux transporter MFP subunit